MVFAFSITFFSIPLYKSMRTISVCDCRLHSVMHLSFHTKSMVMPPGALRPLIFPSFHPSKECALVKRYLDSHYSDDINLEQLASLSHLNKYYLSHEFTRYYGISPISYLTHRRIEVCKNLLENTDHEISDIAHLAGFSSQSYLAQSFRKYCGMTAGEYRRSKKNQTI